MTMPFLRERLFYVILEDLKWKKIKSFVPIVELKSQMMTITWSTDKLSVLIALNAIAVPVTDAVRLYLTQMLTVTNTRIFAVIATIIITHAAKLVMHSFTLMMHITTTTQTTALNATTTRSINAEISMITAINLSLFSMGIVSDISA